MIIDYPHDTAPLKALWKQAFGDTDAFIDGFFQTGFAPRRCRCVYVDGKPVSVLYWFDCLWQGRPVAYLYAIATDKQFRGQGLFRQLLQNTHDYLTGIGYAGAVLVPAEEGLFSMYEKLGYQPFASRKKVAVLAGNSPTPVTPVSPETYLQKRSAYLPENSVCHRENALAFAATYNGFFAGENCLFCAAKEQKTLYFQEFFGDTSLLPGIVKELDAEEGIVPLPENTPFAMYRSFTGNAFLPEFFAMALD